MSVQAMEWVFKHSRAKPTARFVLLAIADHADRNGHHAHPSTATIQSKTGLSERAVRDATTELARLGELVVRRGAGPNGCNDYTIIMTPAGDAASTESTRQEMQGQEMHPRQEMHHPPAAAASLTRQELPPNHPLTVHEPSLKTDTGDEALLDAPDDDDQTATKPGRKRKPKADTDPTANPQFMRWWRTYPNAVKRPDTYRKWLEATQKVSPDELQEKTEAYATAYAASGNHPQYIPMSTTWLNQERWRDPLPRARASPQANGHKPFTNPEDSSGYYGDL